MAVAARVFENGAVKVQASGPDLATLSRLAFCLPKDGTFSTFWTYLPDLRRAFPSSPIQFREGSQEAIRGLLDRVAKGQEGDDEEVRSWFNPDMPPKSYQYRSIHFGLNLERMCLCDQTGIGKTISGLGVMVGAFARGLISRAVISVPASLRSQWLREIHDKLNSRFRPALVKVANGDARQRRAIYRGRWQVLILSHDAVRIDEEEVLRFAPTVGLAICDEASVLRNDENKTTQAHVRTLSPQFRIALTATPIENGLADLYSILRWVDPRIFLSRDYFDARYVVFRKQHIQVKSKRFGKTFTMKKTVPARYVHLEEVRAKLRPAFLRRTAKEVHLELPPVSFTREVLELRGVQRETYDRLRDEAKKEIDGLEGRALMAPLQHLRLAGDSAELVGGPRASAKVDRIKDLLAGEFRGESVLLFTSFKEFVKLLMRELRSYQPVAFTGGMSDRERSNAVTMFTRGQRSVMIATNAGERGLNLQFSGLLVDLDLPWNPASLKQRIGRLCRMGSKFEGIRVRDLIAGDTVEEKLIWPAIQRKAQLFLDVVGDDELSGGVDEADAGVLAGMSAAEVRELL